MIAMLDTSEDLAVCAAELGCAVEQLITPLTKYARKDKTAYFAIDNGSFSKFDKRSFTALLKRLDGEKNLCRFVAVPDVVANARRTLEIFEIWRYKLSGWKLALVAQDGQENLAIPWDGIEAIFIGGSTAWKKGKHAADIIKTAKTLDKWVHVGRVNTPGRFEYFESLGADSIDGTGLSQYTWMRERLHKDYVQPNLYTEPVQ